jgi:hypothetical protein
MSRPIPKVVSNQPSHLRNQQLHEDCEMGKRLTMDGRYRPVLAITIPTTIAAGATVNVKGKIATPEVTGL